MKELCVGKMIAARRREIGLTQQQLAVRLDVTNRAVSKWETGEGYPDIVTLPVLADSLGLSIDQLLRGENPVQQKAAEEAPVGHTGWAQAVYRFETGCILSYLFSMLGIILSAGPFFTNSNFMPFYPVYSTACIVLSLCMLCVAIGVWALRFHRLRVETAGSSRQLVCAVGAHFLRNLLPWMAAAGMAAVKIICWQGAYYVSCVPFFLVLLILYTALWCVYVKKFGRKAEREESIRNEM